MLRTRTLRKGGVMIRWLGRFGTLCGDQLSCQLLECLLCLFWLCSGTFDCELCCTFTFTLYYHDVVVVMSCNFPSCLLYVSHAHIDPVGSHAPHQFRSLTTQQRMKAQSVSSARITSCVAKDRTCYYASRAVDSFNAPMSRVFLRMSVDVRDLT